MKKNIYYFLIFLFILNFSLYAQEGGQPYFEDKHKIVKYIPPIGTMFLYGSKVILQGFDDTNTSSDIEFILYPYIYYSYESFGIYVQPMVRYLRNDFHEIKGNQSYNDEENFGYDNRLIPNLVPKGRVYLLNYFILQRNLQYYFGDFLQTIRIGKLWIDYSPYTIYRTFGPEGIAFYGDIFLVKYEAFYSYNRVSGTNIVSKLWTTNSRHLIGAKFNYDNSDYFSLELIGTYYYTEQLRNEKVWSVRFGKSGIFDILNLEIMDCERYHTEGPSGYSFLKTIFEKDASEDYSKSFYGRFSRISTGFNFKRLNLKFSYRETTKDFLPYNDITWQRYEPLQSSAYDWIYEEERAIKVNEKAYNIQFHYNLAGVKFVNYFDFSEFLDKKDVKQWMLANRPGFLMKLRVQYLIEWLTITHNLWQKNTESEVLQNFGNEIWIPLGNNIGMLPRVEYFLKRRSNNNITSYIVWFFRISYESGNKKILLEMKQASSDLNEPGWLDVNPYYYDQSWGIDNYVRIRFEYNF
jgi:hypothetical protein